MKQYTYRISGSYFEGMETKHFDVEIKATDNVEAMKLVLGDIMLNAKNRVHLDFIHYEILNAARS